METMRLPANLEVEIRPKVGRKVNFTLCAVLFAIALVVGVVAGRMYLVVLLLPIVYFLGEAHRAGRTRAYKPVQLDLSCSDGILTMLMRQTKLMEDGRYADQRYAVSLSDVSSIAISAGGLVELRAKELACESLQPDGRVVESHLRSTAVISFRTDNDSFELFKKFLRSNGY